MTKARRPSRSVVRPTSRPGIWRTSASVAARMPRYGPPYCGAMPSGWPSPAAMSAPYSPGGARTASETGSTTATKSAPAACARRPISAIGSRMPKALGWPARTPATGGPSPSARLQGGQVGRAVVERGQLLELEAGRAEVGARRLEVVAMDGAAGQDALAPGGADGHQRRLGGRRRAVVVRGRDDVEAGQLGDERLVLVDRLQRALADLGLVGRVGRVELAARDDLVDRRRQEVAVDARRPGSSPGRPGCAPPGAPGGRPAGAPARARAGRARGRGPRPGCRRRAGRWTRGPAARASASRSSVVWGP